jgi:hypothetical protein
MSRSATGALLGLGGAIVDRADRKLIFAVTQKLMALFLGVFRLS